MEEVKEETPIDVSLLKKGFFVSVSFVSLRKGSKKRKPEEELEAMFREIWDSILPKDLRDELRNIIARRQYLYSKYAIPVPSLKGHFIPSQVLPEFLNKVSELEKSVKEFAKKIADRREEINRRLEEFNRKYAQGSPLQLLPDDPDVIKEEFGKFSLRINSITIATSNILEALPEIKEKVKEEMLEQVNESARQLEARIKQEISNDLKRKVTVFLKRIAKVKESVEKGKKLHKNMVKSVESDVKRMMALTSLDPELATIMNSLKGIVGSMVSEEKKETVEAKESEFGELAKHLTAKAKESNRKLTEADRELISALEELGGSLTAKQKDVLQVVS